MKKARFISLCLVMLLATSGCRSRNQSSVPMSPVVLETNRMGMTQSEVEEFMKQFVKSLPVTPAEYDTGLDDLVRAAIKGDLERMKSLLEAGHPVDPKDEHRETPLMIASRGDPEKIARMRFRLRKVDET